MTYFGCLIHTHTDTHTLLLSFFCAFHSEATQRHSEHPAVTLGQKAYMLSYNLTHTCNKELIRYDFSFIFRNLWDGHDPENYKQMSVCQKLLGLLQLGLFGVFCPTNW